MAIVDAHSHIYPEKISRKAVGAVGQFYATHMDAPDASAVALMARCPGWAVAILVIQVLTVFLTWFFVYFPVLFIMGISGYMQAAVFDHVFQNLIDRGVIEEENS